MNEQTPESPKRNGASDFKTLFKVLLFVFVLVLAGYGLRAFLRNALEDTILADSPAVPETEPSDKVEPISAETLGKIMLIAEDVTYSKYAENPDHFSDIFVQVTGKIKLALVNEETGSEMIFLSEMLDPDSVWCISYLPEADAGYYYDKGEIVTAYGNHLDAVSDSSEKAILSFIAYHIERIALPDSDETEVTP